MTNLIQLNTPLFYLNICYILIFTHKKDSFDSALEKYTQMQCRYLLLQLIDKLQELKKAEQQKHSKTKSVYWILENKQQIPAAIIITN